MGKLADTIDALTITALTGYNNAAGKPNPFLYSSPSFYAFELGMYFSDAGFAPPTKVRFGRGCTIHASGVQFKIGDGPRRGQGPVTFRQIFVTGSNVGIPLKGSA